MFDMVTTIIKWVSIPVLLIFALFSRFAAGYEFLANLVICTGAVICVQRAVQRKEHGWAAAFVAVVIIFSPACAGGEDLPVDGSDLDRDCGHSVGCLPDPTPARRGWDPVNALIGMRRPMLTMALLAAIPVSLIGQSSEALNWKRKLRFHAEATYEPLALLGAAAYAGVLQADGAPKEWGQGAAAYGKRFGSTVAWAGIHSTLAFGLDSTLHQDPRYFRSGGNGFLAAVRTRAAGNDSDAHR